jgi:hypothetical protein
MAEVRERPPPFLKTSMTGPLGGDAEDPGAPTTYLEDVDGGPLGSDAGSLDAPITFLEGIDSGPHGRRCRMPGSTHHLS